MDTGLTTIPEADIEKHRATAQSMITRVVVLEDSSRPVSTPRLPAPAAASSRPFRRARCASTREVELTKTVASVRPDDQLMSIPQHTLLYRARRGIAIALAVSDVFAPRQRPRKPAGEERPRAARRRRRRAFQEAALGLGLCLGLRARLLSPAADRQPTARRRTTSGSRTSCSTRRRTR